MKLFETLNEDVFLLFAARHYYNPTCIDAEEFHEDLKRFKYLKRLVNRYLDNGKLSERLILNHIIVLNNVFGPEACSILLLFKLEQELWPIIKPFMEYLSLIPNEELKDIKGNDEVIEKLKAI